MTDDDQRRAEQAGVSPPTDRVSDNVNSSPIISSISETCSCPIRWLTLESVLNDPTWSAEAKEQVLMLVLYEGREH